MKKLVCLVCAFMMMAAVAVADVDLSAMSTEDLITLRDQISRELANRDAEARIGEYIAEFDGDTGFAGLTSINVTKDRSGADVLVLDFDYRNTTNNEQTILTAIWTKAYQNGTSLEIAPFIDSAATSTLTNVQPGALVNHCRKYYYLKDPDAPSVEIIIYNGLNFSNPDEHRFELALPEAD